MPPVEVLSYVGVMGVMLFVMWKGYNKITDNHNKDIKELKGTQDTNMKEFNGLCSKIQNRLIVMETKQDIYLVELGYDVHKVNSSIKEHMREIESNEEPSVGCININELKKDKPA